MLWTSLYPLGWLHVYRLTTGVRIRQRYVLIILSITIFLFVGRRRRLIHAFVHPFQVRHRPEIEKNTKRTRYPEKGTIAPLEAMKIFVIIMRLLKYFGKRERHFTTRRNADGELFEGHFCLVRSNLSPLGTFHSQLTQLCVEE